jgi:hypothetical protein
VKIPNLNSSSSSSPIEEMKKFLLNLAREFKIDTGQPLPTKPLTIRSLNFNPKQKEALPQAIEALIKEGIFEDINGSIRLTRIGRDILYQSSGDYYGSTVV